MVPSATTWTIVLLLALRSGLTTLLGVVTAIRLEKNARAIALGIESSAGLMLMVSGVELVPASFRAAGAVHELLPMAARFGDLPLFGAGLGLSVPVYVLLRAVVPD